jgi:hypothetical protein
MIQQPEALRLAAALDALLGYRGINADVGKAAAELRRLHTLNGELLQALRFYAETAVVADIALAAIERAEGKV